LEGNDGSCWSGTSPKSSATANTALGEVGLMSIRSAPQMHSVWGGALWRMVNRGGCRISVQAWNTNSMFGLYRMVVLSYKGEIRASPQREGLDTKQSSVSHYQVPTYVLLIRVSQPDSKVG